MSPSTSGESFAGEVLIAVMNRLADMAIAREQHWYRIPISQAEKLKQQKQWAPRWLAFYQTKVFGDAAYTVTYYAEVMAIREVERRQLFPMESEDANSQKRYCKLELSPLMQRSQPIVSQRLRRIAFIPTTWEKFRQAQEISELL